MYFQHLSIFKKLINWIARKKYNCLNIHTITSSDPDRVKKIFAAAPDCCCEFQKMSEFSSSPIGSTEQIARFVFSPMHINSKTGEIKPNIISHVFSRGCSVQRDTIAPHNEIERFVSNFLSSGDGKRSWDRVLIANCSDLRNITIESKRALCLYDTAEKNNPAHGEICLSREIPETYHAELRFEIMQVFKEVSPANYRNGDIYNRVLGS